MDKNSTIKLQSGNPMPVLGLGTWLLTINTKATIEYALEIGYILIDTSSDYGTHEGIGQAIKSSNIAREKIYIVSKVEETDDSYKRAKSNLSELNLEYLDLLLIHRPPLRGAGEELWQGLMRARNEGLARDIGVSNYSIDLIERLIADSGETPSVNQIEWSPFGYSDEMRKYCTAKNIVIQAYSPLTRARRLRDKNLLAVADKYGKSAAQILIRWNMQQKYVPLPKANQISHLKENINVFDFELKTGDIENLNTFNRRYSSLSFLPY